MTLHLLEKFVSTTVVKRNKKQFIKYVPYIQIVNYFKSYILRILEGFIFERSKVIVFVCVNVQLFFIPEGKYLKLNYELFQKKVNIEKW